MLLTTCEFSSQTVKWNVLKQVYDLDGENLDYQPVGRKDGCPKDYFYPCIFYA